MKCECGCGKDTIRGNRFINYHQLKLIKHKPHSDATKELLRQKTLQMHRDHPEMKAEIGAATKKYFKEHPNCMKERDRLHSIRMSGKNHPMFGKHHSPETCARMSKITKAYMDTHPEFAKEKVRQMKANYSSEDHSRVLKKLYKNPEFHDKIMAAQMHSRKMSSYEQRVLDLIQKYHLPYKFVGNGEVWIGQKNPDFINTNGEKKIIEVYSEYHVGFWKDKDYEVKRSRLFAKYGFQTIFLTEQDLFARDWETICFSKLGVQI